MAISDFGRKSQIFPPRVLCVPPLKGIPLGIGYRRWGSKSRMMGHRETDGQTPGDSKDHAYA